MCLDWKTAIKQLELILNSDQKSFEFLSICALQLSCAYELEGESKKAIDYFYQCPCFSKDMQ